MQVFKYLLRVRKYLIIVYNNHPMKKYAFSVQILGLHDFVNYQKIKDTCLKSLDSLHHVVGTQMSVSLSICSI